jgi:Mannosyltransferase (PIG-V)
VRAVAVQESRDAGRWRASLGYGLTAWLVGVLGCALVTAMACPTPDLIRDPLPGLARVLHAWERWDTLVYESIARVGYRQQPDAAAFFPLYPLLLRLADPVLPGGIPVATLVVSLLACCAALVLTHRLTAEVLGERLAGRTGRYLLAFPTGFYLAAGYNESLFIALAGGSLYCMHRSRWWSAGVLASLAGATRITGILLLLAFVYEYLRQRGFSARRLGADASAVLLVPLGLLGYAGYCWRAFGDPWYFLKAQGSWHRAGVVMPWTTIGRMIALIGGSQPRLGAVVLRNAICLATVLLVIVMLCLALAGRWRLGERQVYLVIFSGASFLVPLVFPLQGDYPLVSIWRYALECLPVFMVLAKLGADRRVERLYLLVTVPVQALMIYVFAQGAFVA